MAEVAIIIGNGFDLDLGLPTKYSDFVKSKEWEAVVKGVELFLQDDTYREHSLIEQLQSASQDSMWFDIEEEIHKFVLSHTNCSDQVVSEIQNEFNRIREGLRAYLMRVSDKFKADERKLGSILLGKLQESPNSIMEINFNYTSPHGFLKFPTYYKYCVCLSIHGSIRDNDMVLGCDLKPNEKVNRQLSFMYKYNMLSKTNHAARSLLGAEDIIFFGHSVNEMDFRYFREFFKVASSSPNPIRHLTIITYDETSERIIKDNIQNQGISVTDLYSNLWTFDFILTSKVYKGDEKEIRKWHEMLRRLMLKGEQKLRTF